MGDVDEIFQKRQDDGLETTSKEIVPAINELNSIMNPFTITSYTISSNVFEIGSSNQVTLKWTYSGSIKSQSINGEIIDIAIRNRTYTSVANNTTYTLNCISNKDLNLSKSVNVNFYNGVYYGVSSSLNYNSSLIKSLTKTISNSNGRTININATSGQYIYYCLPSRLGVPTFNVGGFEGGFELVSTISFTNTYGYTENYDIYKSSNSGLGVTTVVIS